MPVVGYLHVQSKPLPPLCVTLAVLGHVTLLYINCGHFGFESHIQCPFVYTTDAPRESYSEANGDQQSLWRDHFQAFYNMEEKQHWSSYGSFFLFVFFPPDQMLLPQAFRDLKLISPLLMNAKITLHVT